ncbi:hypothetical protein OIU85_002992 [Salix viminalis]|uniref:Uncharacterized protein n=1 Tax=Salix viminalis TaxID=40686 RepID=A0A9Q0PY66_SALVM|nr:hypothetical protein OIU85_002992 [Salix viminalis]
MNQETQEVQVAHHVLREAARQASKRQLHFPHAVHAADPEAVIDVFGNEVTAGARYFIRATSDEDNTTTLAVSATSRIICNSDVTLSPMSDKLPITFSPVEESDDSVIREGAYLNVNFNASSCRMAGVTTMWKIELRPTMRGFSPTPSVSAHASQLATLSTDWFPMPRTLFLLCLNQIQIQHHKSRVKWCRNDDIDQYYNLLQSCERMLDCLLS